jgi:hypothetical protein
VNTLPTVSFIGLSGPYCLDAAAVILTSNQTSGTFSGPGVTNNGDGTGSFLASAAGAGTHSITYSYTDGNSCTATTTQSVTVNAIVTAGTVSGASPLCIGATATYSSNGTTGGTWSSSDDLVATVNASTGVVTAVAAGTATITYTISSGCGSPVTATATVTVNTNGNAGTITGTSTLCTGATATFTSDGNGGGSWSTSDALVATVNASTGVVTAVGAGSATITYTVTGCGPVSTATFGVTVTVCNSIVNVKAYIQGYYTGAGTMNPALMNSGMPGTANETDNITVEIHDGTTGALIGSPVTAVLNTDGTCAATFPALTGSHYIVIKHRNALETWSAAPVALGATTTYDFTTSAAQAYGSNMVDVGGGVFAMWSGDLNQDGGIEAEDYSMMENDIQLSLFGYYTSDITGDGGVEAEDYSIMENNVQLSIFVAKPF